MPRATQQGPKRRRRWPSEFPHEVVARNIKAYRGSRGLTQAELAERMQTLGFDWSPDVASYVERGGRDLAISELVALAVVLDVPQSALLDPFEHRRDPLDVGGRRDPLDLDLGGPSTVSADYVSLWLRGWASLWLSDEGGLCIELTARGARLDEHEIPEPLVGAWRLLRDEGPEQIVPLHPSWNEPDDEGEGDDG